MNSNVIAKFMSRIAVHFYWEHSASLAFQVKINESSFMSPITFSSAPKLSRHHYESNGKVIQFASHPQSTIQ